MDLEPSIYELKINVLRYMLECLKQTYQIDISLPYSLAWHLKSCDLWTYTQVFGQIQRIKKET
jgi:hypothetical protein